jgi:crotonobetainyl-CoA:carnitine CoA-transferase CaiB-like acyl-CoA transferase
MTPVLSPEDLLEDEHLKQTGFFERHLHPSEGEIRQTAISVKFSRTPGSVRRLAPRLDEHREETLCELKEQQGA